MNRLKMQILVVLSVLTASVGGDATAQNGPNAQAPTRVPALVAITQGPAAARQPFLVMRRAGGTPIDVIVLPESAANGANLSQAVYLLLAARRTEGDTARASRAFGGEVKTSQGQLARELPWAQRVVSDARNAHARVVPGVGRARTVQIWLPSHRRKR